MAAKYMGFSTYPISKVAHKVCSVVIGRILKHEKRVRARRAKDQATFEVAVKRILKKYGYPPDLQSAAIQTVLEQAEAFSEKWAA